MSLKKVHLRKALKLLYLPNAKRTSSIRADLRADLAENSEGGDFHVPFWADAKDHVAEISDLRESIEERIKANEGRKRLYPLLGDGFLSWWNEKRRWRNEPFKFVPESVRAQLLIPELDLTVKVENLLALRMGDHSHRIIYPYFSEEPILNEEGSRIALALLQKALPDYGLSDLRVLDVLRGASRGASDTPLVGNEMEIFMRRYSVVLQEWQDLQAEYV